MRIIDKINTSERRSAAPGPNTVDSKYVMECLRQENEGDGMLFAALMENKLLYAAANDSWYIWCGNGWKRDTTATIQGLVRYVTERYGEEIVELEKRIEETKKEMSDDEHEPYAKAWNKKIGQLDKKIKSLRQPRGRTACIQFASTHYNNPFAIEGNEFDKDPWLLGVRNGVVDLRSGQLYPGRPDQLISKHCSCDFVGCDPKNSQGWRQFVNEIYDGDEDTIDFLHMLFGYGITGLTSEHIFPFLLGKGRNGKSLLINSLVRVIGDYAAVVPSELFLKSNQPRGSNQTDPAIMKLEGLRLAVSSEVEEGAHFSAQQVKRITGGDTLEGRNPYDKELRNFSPTHLCIMVGNHEPVPPSGDPAFWDRTYLIQHPVRFVKNPDPEKNERLADPHIEEKLLTMDEQILAWLVEGCMKWQANGKRLEPPPSVLKATSEYQDEADWISQFIDACCVKTDNDTGATILYAAFVIWYRENINAKKNYTPTQRMFGMKLKAIGIEKPPRRADGVYYRNISLNINWQNRMLQEYGGEKHSHDNEP